MTNINQNVIERLTPLLRDSVVSTLIQFREEHPNDDMYAFALITPTEGTRILAAIATEQTLDAIAEEYAQLGYKAKTGDTIALLRKSLRWSNPDDGWYYFFWEMDEPVNHELEIAFKEGDVEMFDGTTEALCIEALKQLDQNGVFGKGAIRHKLTLGFTYGVDEQTFVMYSEKVNPFEVYRRTKRELEEGYKVDKQIEIPSHRGSP